jgi:hypothetical protein
MKRGAIELSVNFVIVSIISIVLIGMGMFLIIKGNQAMTVEYGKVKAFHESQIRDALARNGDPVMVYPNTITVKQGEDQIFTVGINNELGEDKWFCVYPANLCGGVPGCIDLLEGDYVMDIKNTETGFYPVKIITDKAVAKKSYIINVCVFNTTDPTGVACVPSACPSPGNGQTNLYGDLQKIIVNVR